MRIVVLDSAVVPGVTTGPGSPAYFSRFLVEHLREAGHEVEIHAEFDAGICTEADLVWSEWVNEPAYEAAASGVCKRLVLRMRGYDAFGPLGKLEWQNVDALVYESPFLKQLVEEQFKGLKSFPSHVIPSGIDVAHIPFKERGHGLNVAMVARGVADKGFQLAWVWARSRPAVRLHAALAMPEPRLLRYLQETKPDNVTMYPQVDTVKWLDEIDANYLLSASNWESLGYTIAEAMAMGIKPLVHATPGSVVNWPIPVQQWISFAGLDVLAHGMRVSKYDYASRAYRAFVEERLDAAKQSKKFAELALSIPARPARARSSYTSTMLLTVAMNALGGADLAQADQLVTRFREITPATPAFVDHRSGLALLLAARYYAADDLAHAKAWALRSMLEGPRANALALLGEIAAEEGDFAGAERWYVLAANARHVPSRYDQPTVTQEIGARWADVRKELAPLSWYGKGSEYPKRFLVVVATRNAEQYIDECLQSISKADFTPFHCVVVDDNSTDNTYALVAKRALASDRFTTLRRADRRGSLYNIVHAIRENGRPGDVIVILDGDDQLLPPALNVIATEYRAGAWLTYGNFKTTSGKLSWMPPYPRDVLNDGRVREYPWQVSHPKTFRYELFQHLTDADFTEDGKWFMTAGDVALMLPMLELAGERAVYIPTPIYVYNDQSPANDHRVDPDGQVRVRDLIYARPPKCRLKEL
ncbi:MAG: glycosyltransferase [Candidatus Eremiobacteraeota bacterium]|nr:glycosyltransferase [Candidatus Eremiobacteraeota bacterium]